MLSAPSLLLINYSTSGNMYIFSVLGKISLRMPTKDTSYFINGYIPFQTQRSALLLLRHVVAHSVGSMLSVAKEIICVDR